MDKLNRCIFWLKMISFDSALKKDENYYPQSLSREPIYIKRKVIRHITDDLENSYDDSDYSEN